MTVTTLQSCWDPSRSTAAQPAAQPAVQIPVCWQTSRLQLLAMCQWVGTQIYLRAGRQSRAGPHQKRSSHRSWPAPHHHTPEHGEQCCRERSEGQVEDPKQHSRSGSMATSTMNETTVWLQPSTAQAAGMGGGNAHIQIDISDCLHTPCQLLSATWAGPGCIECCCMVLARRPRWV
jgi:hypothetical protein